MILSIQPEEVFMVRRSLKTYKKRKNSQVRSLLRRIEGLRAGTISPDLSDGMTLEELKKINERILWRRLQDIEWADKMLTSLHTEVNG